jgi:ubiquinone biosynthesis protein
MVAILSTIREIDRLRQIAVVLARHGFTDIVKRMGLLRVGKKRAAGEAQPAESANGEGDGLAQDIDIDLGELEKVAAPEVAKSSLAERVRLVAMDLGPSFVKLGQIVSTRRDVLPAEWVTELKKLQDEVKPLPFETIKTAVETALGGSLETFYDRFDEKPLAAASIGQVHRAVLKTPDGPRDVVVKVQRPGIRATITSDLELLHTLARMVDRSIPELRAFNPIGMVEQFDRAITAELDFLLEAENAGRFRKNFEGWKTVRFPHVYKEASTREVLTLELLPGKKVYEAIEKDGLSGETIAKNALAILIKMVFEDGFFHADPHPGNILISGTPDDTVIGLIDLGMVGRLSPELRDRCIDLMLAAVRNDPNALADALYAIGTPSKRVDMRAYRAHVAVVSEKHLGKPLKEMDLAAMIGDLVSGAQKFGIEIPPDFLLVGKALMTIEGVGREIHPDLDFFEEGKPHFVELLKKRYSPQRLGNELWRGLEKIGSSTYDLPQLTREVLEDLRLGRLAVTTTDPKMPTALDRLGRRLFSGFVVAGLAIAGAWLVASGERPLAYVLLGLAGVTLLVHLAGDALRRWG